MIIAILFYHDTGLKSPPSEEEKLENKTGNEEKTENLINDVPKNNYKIKEIQEINITTLPQLFLREQV